MTTTCFRNSNSPSIATGASTRTLGWMERRCRDGLFALLSKLDGELLVVERFAGGEPVRLGSPTTWPALRSTITLHSPALYVASAIDGHIGAAREWISESWDCDDLVALMRMFTRSSALGDRLDRRGLGRWFAPLASAAYRWLSRNTRARARQHISAHYDLGNDFFAAVLDETMTYSCALFNAPNTSLAAAQLAKIDTLLARLDLSCDQHLLEIGTGWGSLALRAAERFGCRVTTTTISRRQLEVAKARVVAAGFADRIDCRADDYRDLVAPPGGFDAIASVEMIEAVGWQFLGPYFANVDRLLKPGGRAVIQAITIEDQRFEQTKRSVDFIKKMVFPGSCIPSVTSLCAAATRHSRLRLVQLNDYTEHYVETLLRWRARLHEQDNLLRAAGYSRELLRLWDFYLCYCAAGFYERSIGLVHTVWEKSGGPAPSVAIQRRGGVTPASVGCPP
ncbi:MAG: class I SAM-dependent methyltransferase [Planctomycetota bacterium]